MKMQINKVITSIVIVVMTSSGCLMSVWDGVADWTLIVKVKSAENGKPIAGAKANIVKRNENSFGDIESFAGDFEGMGCVTNSEGFCHLNAEFNSYGKESKFKRESYINFKHRDIVVTAEGYKPHHAPIKTYIQTPLKLGENNPYKNFQSEIIIELEEKDGGT